MRYRDEVTKPALVRMPEPITPTGIRSHILENPPNEFCLHRFGNHTHIQTMRDIGDALDEKLIIFMLIEVAHKAAVDLQIVDL